MCKSRVRIWTGYHHYNYESTASHAENPHFCKVARYSGVTCQGTATRYSVAVYYGRCLACGGNEADWEREKWRTRWWWIKSFFSTSWKDGRELSPDAQVIDEQSYEILRGQARREETEVERRARMAKESSSRLESKMFQKRDRTRASVSTSYLRLSMAEGSCQRVQAHMGQRRHPATRKEPSLRQEAIKAKARKVMAGNGTMDWVENQVELTKKRRSHGIATYKDNRYAQVCDSKIRSRSLQIVAADLNENLPLSKIRPGMTLIESKTTHLMKSRESAPVERPKAQMEA